MVTSNQTGLKSVTRALQSHTFINQQLGTSVAQSVSSIQSYCGAKTKNILHIILKLIIFIDLLQVKKETAIKKSHVNTCD